MKAWELSWPKCDIKCDNRDIDEIFSPIITFLDYEQLYLQA